MKFKKRVKNNIKAVLFDIGGVLSLGEAPVNVKGEYRHLGIHNYVARKLKVSIDQYFDAIDTNYALAIEGKISREKTLKIFSKNLNSTTKKLEKLYHKAFKKNFKQNIELFKKAYNLKKLGYKIGILSDQWYLSKKALITNDISRKFDEVIVSCDVGVRKPNPKIYQIAIKRLKLKSEDILFIDNQSWNISPAKKIGMKTILFKDNKQLFKNKLWKSLFLDKNMKLK